MVKKLPIILGVVLALVLGAGYLLLAPRSPEPPITFDNTESEIFMALASAGITAAVVDIQGATVIVDFELPAGADLDAAVGYALAAAATAAPESETISVQVYQDGQPLATRTASTADVLATAHGEMTVEELESRIRAS